MHRIMKKGEYMRLFFTKMHGLGNDYIYMDGFDSRMSKPAAWSSEQKGRLAVVMSRRHTGIGADGLIFIQPSEEAAFRMEMYNADGSRGAMCGNGIRCAARYAYDHGISTNQSFQVQTDSGIRSVYIRKTDEGEHITSVRVDMGVMADMIPMWKVQNKDYSNTKGYKAGLVTRQWGYSFIFGNNSYNGNTQMPTQSVFSVMVAVLFS